MLASRTPIVGHSTGFHAGSVSPKGQPVADCGFRKARRRVGYIHVCIHVYIYLYI